MVSLQLTTYTCSIAGQTATIIFDAGQTANHKLVFLASVRSGVLKDYAQFKTMYSPGNFMEVPDHAGVTINDARAPAAHEIPMQSLFHNYICAGQSGSLTVNVNILAILTRNSGIVQVTLPSFSGVATGGTLRCLWIQTGFGTQSAASCSYLGTPMVRCSAPADVFAVMGSCERIPNDLLLPTTTTTIITITPQSSLRYRLGGVRGRVEILFKWKGTLT